MNFTSICAGADTERGELTLIYTRQQLLTLRQRNISSLLDTNIIIDYKALALCTKTYHKRRSSRGIKRRLNIRQRPVLVRNQANNLVRIKSLDTITSKDQSKAQLPSLLYTNCRSLNEWKLNELDVIANTYHPTIICLTETWLDAVKEQSRQLPSYQHFFCNRKNRTGGGVGILVADGFPTTLLSSCSTSTYSAVWTLSLLENYGHIITGCIYHPPDAQADKTLDYIGSTLAYLCQTHPLAKFIITGDFNHLPVEDLCVELDIKNLVHFNTRNEARLDLVLTNIPEYKSAVKLAPICNNDHCCILLNSDKAPKPARYTRTTKRTINTDRKARVLCDLAQQSWETVLTANSVHNKVEALHNTINVILDKHCPYKTKKVRRDRPGWITPSLVKLIRARDKAYKNGSKVWKQLRANVKRRIRTAKRSYVNDRLYENHNTK
jgi:hypothetical protein